jgi:hypothetical protein
MHLVSLIREMGLQRDHALARVGTRLWRYNLAARLFGAAVSRHQPARHRSGGDAADLHSDRKRRACLVRGALQQGSVADRRHNANYLLALGDAWGREVRDEVS